MNVPMISTMRQTYKGRALKADDTFDAASEEEAADLVAVNCARRAKRTTAASVVQVPKAETITRDVTAEAASEADEPAPIGDGGASEASSPQHNSYGNKNKYDHRAMRAKR